MPKHAVKSRFEKELKAFGKNLRAVRKRKGLTLEALAEKSGIAYDSLANIELGKLNTTLASLYAISDGLGVEPKSLFDF